MTTNMVMSRQQVIEALTERDGYVCYMCPLPFDDDRHALTIDHFIPTSKGGPGTLDNLRLAGLSCNQDKADRLWLDDGNLEPRRSGRPISARANREQAYDRFCMNCQGGRLLFEGESCEECGQGPGPRGFPAWAQRKPKECDHSTYHCFMCVLGFVDRKTVVETLIFGE